ncbi:MAG: hypothetical protein JJD97_05050 [Gemmatimonadaceae bacterium]|nr:hypothetical protein [Gemmatimonadaceae bacterium]
MTRFNRLFIGSVVAAALLTLIHTGMWAFRSTQPVGEQQESELASDIAMTSNGSAAFASTSATAPDSGTGATHTGTR